MRRIPRLVSGADVGLKVALAMAEVSRFCNASVLCAAWSANGSVHALMPVFPHCHFGSSSWIEVAVWHNGAPEWVKETLRHEAESCKIFRTAF